MKLKPSFSFILFLILAILGSIFPPMFIYALITLSVYTIIKVIQKIKNLKLKAKGQTSKLQNGEEEEEEKEMDENNVFLEDKFFRDDSYEDDDAIKDDDTIKNDDGIADVGIYYA